MNPITRIDKIMIELKALNYELDIAIDSRTDVRDAYAIFGIKHVVHGVCDRIDEAIAAIKEGNEEQVNSILSRIEILLEEYRVIWDKFKAGGMKI